MIIRSNYRDGECNQFEMEVIGESIDSEFHEPCYLVRLLPKYQNQFQEKNKITELRKSLVGDKENLYSIKKGATVEQLTLF